MQDKKILVGDRYNLPQLAGRPDKSRASDLVSVYSMVEGEAEVCEIIRDTDPIGQSLGYIKVKMISTGGGEEIYAIDAIEFICAVNGLPVDKMPPEIVRDLGQAYL